MILSERKMLYHAQSRRYAATIKASVLRKRWRIISSDWGTTAEGADQTIRFCLFQDTNLSTNGMSCNTCHADFGAFQPSFAQPYPHQVVMAKEKGSVETVHLDEMIQFCMVAPMQAKPLPWNSHELAALTAYVADLRNSFQAAKQGKAGNRPEEEHP